MIDIRTEGLPGIHVMAQRCRAHNREEVRKLRLRCDANASAWLAVFKSACLSLGARACAYASQVSFRARAARAPVRKF